MNIGLVLRRLRVQTDARGWSGSKVNTHPRMTSDWEVAPPEDRTPTPAQDGGALSTELRGRRRAILPYHRARAPKPRPSFGMECHLCDEASVLLDDMLGTDAWDAVDIEADDDLLLRYAHRIPVLAIDGRIGSS